MKIEIISGSYGWRKTKDAMPKLVERGGVSSRSASQRSSTKQTKRLLQAAARSKAATPPAPICPAKKTAQRAAQRPISTRSSYRK